MKLYIREWSGRREVRKDMREGLHTAIWQYALSKTTPELASFIILGL
jgi:hypothetical protein